MPDAHLRSPDAHALAARLRALCTAHTGVEERVDAFGHTTFRVADKPIVFVGEDSPGGAWFSVKATPETAPALIARGPWTRTPYIGRHGWISARAEDEVDWDEVEDLIEAAWFRAAPARLRPWAG